MTIHHAIIKRAAKLNVTIEHMPEEDAGNQYKATWGGNKKHPMHALFGATAKIVLDDAAAIIDMAAYYRSFKIDIVNAETVNIKVTGTDIEVTGLRAAAAFPIAKKAWIESRQELDIDDEDADEEVDAEIEEEADDRGGSVVKQKYRARYAEMGHPNTCGDWLSTTLNEYTTNKAGFNLELFAQLCAENGVDMSKYLTEKASDRGRYKMTGRNKLAKVVWERGYLLMGGNEVKVDAEWAAKQRFAKPKAAPAPTPKKS